MRYINKTKNTKPQYKWKEIKHQTTKKKQQNAKKNVKKNGKRKRNKKIN